MWGWEEFIWGISWAGLWTSGLRQKRGVLLAAEQINEDLYYGLDSSVCRFGDFMFTDVAVRISSHSQYCKYVTAWSTVEWGFDFRQVKRPFVRSVFMDSGIHPNPSAKWVCEFFHHG